jgi:hypothetical protein
MKLEGFITVFTRSYHWTLFWVRRIQTISSHPIYLIFSLTLFSHLSVGLESGRFYSGFPTKILNAHLISQCILHAPPISSSLIYHSTNIWWRVQIIKSLIRSFYLSSCYFLSLGSKIFSLHPVLKHSKPCSPQMLNYISICKFFAPNIVKVVKSRRMKCAGHVARTGTMRNSNKILAGKRERPLRRPRRRWEITVEWVLEE